MAGDDKTVDPNQQLEQTQHPAQETNVFRRVEAYAVKLPSFWSELPEGWFVQVEAQFRTSRITEERTKFDYALQALNAETVKSVYQTIIKCQTDLSPYTTLKNALIKKYSLSDNQKLQQLLEGTEMGDRKPSEYYNSLELLAGSSNAVNDQLLRSIWMRRLPPLVQAVIQGKENLSTEALLASADSVFEVCDTKSFNVSQISTATQPVPSVDRFTELENRLINVIEKKFSQLTTRRNRSHSRGRNQTQKSQSSNNSSGLCYYHAKFGDKAQKCREPCSSKN